MRVMAKETVDQLQGGGKLKGSERQEKDRSFLGTEKFSTLMPRLAIPTMVAQVVNVLYSMVDRMFVGHIPEVGAAALTAIGICMPLLMVVSAFASFAGAGGAPLAAIRLGQGDARASRKVVAASTVLLAIFAVACMVVGYAFAPQLLSAFGASSATLPYALSYFRICLAGTPFVMVSVGLSAFLLAQGDSSRALVATGSGALINIALDALFILVLGMGIEGAATASIISQFASAVFVMLFLQSKNSTLRLERSSGKIGSAMYRKILSLGSGPFFIGASEGILTIVLNVQMQVWGGDAYVGALTVLETFNMLVVAIAMGFTQGTQPIMSYSFGAGLTDRVRRASRTIRLVAFAITAAIGVIVIVFARPIASAFTTDEVIAEIIISMTPIYLSGLSFFGLQLGVQSTFMGLGKGMYSLVVAFVRKIVLFIPLALILPNFFGAPGVVYAEPVSDFISIVFCNLLLALTMRKFLAPSTPSAQSTSSAQPTHPAQ